MLGAAATVLAAMAAHASAFETEHASPFRTEAHGAQLRAVRSGTCPPGFEPFRGAGANLFDAIWTAESMAPHVSFNDSLQSIGSYAASGLKVFRMFASLWGPYQRKWVTDPVNFWANADKVMDAIEKHGLYVIPSIGLSWHVVAEDETLNDFVLNRSSASRALAHRYYEEFVGRYHARKSVLFWELGNEFNLLVNLPPPHCDAREHCFTTKPMNALLAELVGVIVKSTPSYPQCAWPVHMSTARYQGRARVSGDSIRRSST